MMDAVMGVYCLKRDRVRRTGVLNRLFTVNKSKPKFKVHIYTDDACIVNLPHHVFGHYKYPAHLTTQICKRLCKWFANAGDNRMNYVFQLPLLS